MKKTQTKDALRNITHQAVSWLSIVVIALLGAACYLGLSYAARAIKTGGSNFYQETNFRDLEILSTVLMNDADIEAIRATEGVADVEGVYMTSAKAENGTTHRTFTILSLPQRINLPRMTAGRLPESDGECAVEEGLLATMGWQMGDTIRLHDSDGENAPYLRLDQFTVVGTFYHPDRVTLRAPGDYTVLVREESFDLEALEGSFMKAEVIAERPASLNRFDKAYFTSTLAMENRLAALGKERATIRAEELRSRYQAEIDANKAKLDEAKTRLSEGRALLDEKAVELTQAMADLAQGEAELARAQEQLTQAKTQLDQGAAQLDQARQELREGKSVLDQAASRLASGRAQLSQSYSEIESGKNRMRSQLRASIDPLAQLTGMSISWASGGGSANMDSRSTRATNMRITSSLSIDLRRSFDENMSIIADALFPETGLTPEVRQSPEYSSARNGYDTLSQACKQWDARHEEYLAGLDEYNSGKSQYDASEREFRAGEARYEASREEYEAGLRSYEEGSAAYAEGLQAYLNGQEELKQAEADYTAGTEEYERSVDKLAEAQETLNRLGNGLWVQFNCKGNSSYLLLDTVGDNLAKLEMTFSLLFILVGALVIYATISKMVDEQRRLVGATKAFGFLNREIFAKYLAFGVSATLLGTALGVAVGYFGLQTILLHGYAPYYAFGQSPRVMLPLPTLVVIVFGVLLSCAAIWIACTRLLRSTAISLMQPQIPVSVRGTGKGGKRFLSLFSRLILRNMRSDLKRVAVTVVSVGGCCALLVIGFTLKSAVSGAVERQYGGIISYDQKLTFDPKASETVEEDLEAVLNGSGASWLKLKDTVVSYQVTDSMEVAELLCVDGRINDYYALRDWKTNALLTPTGEGILIQKRLAECYDLEPGDSLEILDSNAKIMRKARISGVFDNYIGRTMVISEEYYQLLFEEPSVKNAYFINLNGVDAGELGARLSTVPGFENYAGSDTERASYASISTILDALIAGLVIIAAVMAAVVLLNLANMYVMQKTRELTVMRINGYSVGQVIRYVSLETVATTFLGILLGVSAGAGLAYLIVRALEQPHFQLARQVSPMAWVYAVIITIFFTVIVNAIALRKVPHLKLTDLS